MAEYDLSLAAVPGLDAPDIKFDPTLWRRAGIRAIEVGLRQGWAADRRELAEMLDLLGICPANAARDAAPDAGRLGSWDLYSELGYVGNDK